MLKEEKSHFEDDEEFKDFCKHPQHNPPMHLYIPKGKKYVHICPGCKKRSVIYSSLRNISWKIKGGNKPMLLV